MFSVTWEGVKDYIGKEVVEKHRCLVLSRCLWSALKHGVCRWAAGSGGEEGVPSFLGVSACVYPMCWHQEMVTVNVPTAS